MEALRILIVEDEPAIAILLQDIVEATVRAEVIVRASIKAAEEIAAGDLAFALLDVDVLDGKTFELARALKKRNVPLAFVTGSPKGAIPGDLQTAPFVAKPFTVDQIIDQIEEILPQQTVE